MILKGYLLSVLYGIICLAIGALAYKLGLPKKYSRKLGNQVIIDISECIENSLSNDYIFIRYMGPKFVIVFSGIDIDSVTTFVADIKNQVEGIDISLPDNKKIDEIEIETIGRKKKKRPPTKVNAKLNFVLTTYYKGTGMEAVLKKLEQYVDNADKTENDITCI